MTPYPIPATEIERLIEKVNDIVQQCPRDMLAIRRSEIEAKRLLDLSEFSAAAASVLGMLSAIQDDLVSLTKWHELSIQISGHDFVSYDHYASSLLHVFEYEKALDMAKIAFEKSGRRKPLDLMITSCLAMGDEDTASEYIFEWSRRFGEEYPGMKMLGVFILDGILDECAEEISERKNILREDEFDFQGMRALAEEIRSSK